ncbi:unannotated protein [freshwater metagenome]|uniref:Unannotated protein n=1 Tax=freshwater metagenome TaxID=449393 RepID=A0A6J6JS65_9ZZZZ
MARAKIPIPKPKGISTAIIEFRSFAREPRIAIITAATIEPSVAPTATFRPISSAMAPPAKDNSLIP